MMPNGEMRTVLSATFGNYRFTELPVGQTYIVSVSAKHFTFSQPTIVCTLLEEITDLDFIADVR